VEQITGMVAKTKLEEALNKITWQLNTQSPEIRLF
jgi:hypothetical protein